MRKLNLIKGKKYHIIYGRKSKYTGKGESIDNQIELIKQKLEFKYPEIDLENDILVFTDEGFTGANTNRPDFQYMMDIIRQGYAKSLNCYRLDRVSRNVGDFCNLINELQKYGTEFLSIREDFDTRTPMGKAMLLICSVFAQLERDTIAERIRDNMMELAKTGRWLGGTTPTGFKSQEIQNITVDGKSKKLFKLTEILVEKNLVNLLKDKYIELKSQTGLETYTIQNNLKTKTGKRFTRWSLVNILSNPVYAMADEATFDYFTEKGAVVIGNREDYNGKYGLMVYNKTEQLTGKGKQDNPVTEWIVAIGKHKGFWTGKEYVEVQELLLKGANKRFRKPAKNNALLSGILRCSYCDSFMRPKLTQSYTPDGELKFSYLCELKDKSRSKMCNHKNLNGNEADKIIVNIIKKLANLSNDFYKAIKDIADGKFDTAESTSNEVLTLESEYKKNEHDIEVLIDRLKIVPADIVEEIGTEISKLKNANKEIEERLKLLNVDRTDVFKNEDSAKTVLDIMDNYFSKFDDLDLLRKRTLIKLLINSVYSDGEKLFINLVGSRKNVKLIGETLCDNSK